MLQKLLINMRSIALASSSDEPTLIEELIDYVVSKYLTPNFGAYDYQYIDTRIDGIISPAMIFIGAFLALMIASSIMIFNKRVLGRLVRRLLRRDAISPDRALTLSDVDMHESRAIRLFINRTTLSRSVRCREEDEHYGIEYIPVVHADYSGTEEAKAEEAASDTKEKDTYAIAMNTPRRLRYKRDPDKDHFYIPERKKYRESVRFDSKGTNPLSVIILGVVYIVVGLLFIRFLPSLMKVIDNMLVAFNGF